MYRKIYWIFIGITFALGQIFIFINFKIGVSVFLAMVLPALVSYFNIEFIEWLNNHKGSQMVFRYNVIQFIIKSVFICLIVFIGVKLIDLNYKIFVPLLCFIWFSFHMIEAFFTNDLINK